MSYSCVLKVGKSYKYEWRGKWVYFKVIGQIGHLSLFKVKFLSKWIRDEEVWGGSAVGCNSIPTSKLEEELHKEMK